MITSTTRVALVGADTLLGREIKDVIASGARKALIQSFASNGEANFGEEGDETVFRQALGLEILSQVNAVISAGSPAGAVKALNLARAVPERPILIDCTGSLDHEAESRIFAPLIDDAVPQSHIVAIAHPAAAALAATLSRLAVYGPISRAIFEIFEPASEQGRLGLAELQQQTSNLLSFKTLDKKIYDAQVSFAMLPAYGEDAPQSLASIEQRIEKHLAAVLARLAHSGTTIPMPSLRLVQAPVFHGYTFSGWIEFESHAQPSEIEATLALPHIDVRASGQGVPTNIGVAGQSGLVVGDIRVDRNNSRAIWLWAVSDNLRTVADGVRELISKVER
ncbi:MAG: Asd/ArgC dimerization domain-containing protein [Bryobacteraceae bacterium]